MQTDVNRYWQLPSVFWLGQADAWIVGATAIGAMAAFFAFMGIAQGWMLLICFLLYLSFVTGGQDFMSFQWDSLLLEVGFIALFAVPWGFGLEFFVTSEPHWTVRWMFYGVLFKLMFLSGVVKLLSGDESWRDFTAMTYHFWTQPLPNPLSPFFHFMPVWFQKFNTIVTFIIELGVPFLIWFPRTRVIAAAAFTGLSLMILLTGNYTFFNWLTIFLCFWLIPDSWWDVILNGLPFKIEEVPTSLFAQPLTISVMVFLGACSLLWCTRFVMNQRMNELVWPVLRVVQSLHISNSYGLFANMTKSRPEIVIEGSLDGREWKEYEFKYKPGNLYRRPPIVAPHQPRLDWQMWFAALGSFQRDYWVQNLFVRMFENSPDVMDLFDWNPFEEEPPKYLRARLYEYEFTSRAKIFESGLWWKRSLIGEYSPTFERP